MYYPSAKLICVFVFAYAKSWFSHDEAHIMETTKVQLSLRIHTDCIIIGNSTVFCKIWNFICLNLRSIETIFDERQDLKCK